MNYLMLVNKNNRLNKDYVPDNLTVVKNRKGDKPNLILLLDKVVYKKFLEMVKVAYNDGYDIICDSAYRSYDYQEKLYKELLKSKKDISYLAKPGESEHQTGLCVDIAAYQKGRYVDDPRKLEKEYKWLFNNSFKFGFILRYPKGKRHITGYPYEPWHFRYVGVLAATRIMNEGITLEEYLGKVG
ncbi:MAG: M15 family metallopeptidase [Bacilli bacterium]|nr:M15 family metallopeptidase [Bacilli bacterium]